MSRKRGWLVIEREDARLGERLLRCRRRGLPTVLHAPMAGCREKFALVAVGYGASHLDFSQGPRGRTVRCPAGVAHFLEHQLFEGPSANAFAKFAQLGASANAYTDYTETAYHFSCTGRFREAFRELLDFVSKPHFTEETVAKEKGVIAEEIRMYLDDPDSVALQHLRAALYALHPVRIDIAGTLDSIRKITPALLYDCYGAFYRPERLVVVTAGDLPLDPILEDVERAFAPRGFRTTGRPPGVPVEGREPDRIARRTVRRPMAVSHPRIFLGFKDRPVGQGGFPLLRRRLEISLLLQILFGPGSAWHQETYEKGWIDDDFGFGFQGHVDYGYSLIGGRSLQPDALRKAVLAELGRAAREGIPEAEVERMVRKSEGDFLRAFHFPGSLGPIVASCHLAGVDLFDYPSVLRRIRRRDLEARLGEHLVPNRCAVSQISPLAARSGASPE